MPVEEVQKTQCEGCTRNAEGVCIKPTGEVCTPEECLVEDCGVEDSINQ